MLLMLTGIWCGPGSGSGPIPKAYSISTVKEALRKSILWLTKLQICFTIILWCFTWGVFVTSYLPNDKCASQLPWVTNTPQMKHHRIIVKRICHFVSQMILYLGPLLQCAWCYNNTTLQHCVYLTLLPLSLHLNSCFPFLETSLSCQVLTRKWESLRLIRAFIRSITYSKDRQHP
jgi:hypothetical protein